MIIAKWQSRQPKLLSLYRNVERANKTTTKLSYDFRLPFLLIQCSLGCYNLPFSKSSNKASLGSFRRAGWQFGLVWACLEVSLRVFESWLPSLTRLPTPTVEAGVSTRVSSSLVCPYCCLSPQPMRLESSVYLLILLLSSPLASLTVLLRDEQTSQEEEGADGSAHLHALPCPSTSFCLHRTDAEPTSSSLISQSHETALSLGQFPIQEILLPVWLLSLWALCHLWNVTFLRGKIPDWLSSLLLPSKRFALRFVYILYLCLVGPLSYNKLSALTGEEKIQVIHSL